MWFYSVLMCRAINWVLFGNSHWIYLQLFIAVDGVSMLNTTERSTKQLLCVTFALPYKYLLETKEEKSPGLTWSIKANFLQVFTWPQTYYGSWCWGKNNGLFQITCDQCNVKLGHRGGNFNHMVYSRRRLERWPQWGPSACDGPCCD